ncbi:MAG: DUF4124 domain-containing protein [Gammaproteobacteria bacterium]|nr:DUF4124 domain-containing protein [Gammaproteobacteria bacterium]
MKSLSICPVLLVALLSLSSVAHAQMEKWVDKDGNIHYGSVTPTEYDSEPVKNAPITSSIGSVWLSCRKKGRQKKRARLLA